jgi:Tol biopolymer transport system component/DNA-binding winged helix-turn-helix (wHTH) protein
VGGDDDEEQQDGGEQATHGTSGRMGSPDPAVGTAAAPEEILPFSSRALRIMRAMRIGEWMFDPRSHELVRGDARERLPRRLGLLLERLAREPGVVVSRETLLRDVWGRVHVDEDLLSRNVAALRRALGDDPREPRYVETIPKSGYRLVARVASAPPAADAPARPTTGGAVSAVVALAIAAVAAWLLLPRDTTPPASADALARAEPLTSEPGWELGPALSRDGQLVAYARSAPGSGEATLVVRNIDGTAERALDEPGRVALAPAFLPDGSSIVFRSIAEGSCELRVRSLYAASRRLADCATGNVSVPDVSRDGTRVVFAAPPARPDRASGLAIVAIADGSVVSLTSPTLDEGADVDPRFAPDDRVTFARGDAGSQRLFVADPATGRVEPLWPVLSRLSGHAWTPRGDAIVVASDDPGYRALVLFDPATRAATLLGAREGQRPSFADDGSLVFELARFDANIWAWHAADGSVKQVAGSTRYDGVPRLAPDGRRFAYVSTRADQESIWIASLDGTPEQRVPLAAGTRWTLPDFSPDGAYLLVTAWDGNTTTLHEHEIATGRTRRVDAAGDAAFAGQYSGDGATIVFARRGDGASKSLWRVARAGGEARQLAPAIDRFAASGDIVAYGRRGERGLQLLSLSGGEPRAVDVDIGAANRQDWTLVGEVVWFAALTDDGAPALFRHDLRDGTTREATREVVPTATSATLSAAADGSLVLFARVDSVSIDLMRAAGVAPAR